MQGNLHPPNSVFYISTRYLPETTTPKRIFNPDMFWGGGAFITVPAAKVSSERKIGSKPTGHRLIIASLEDFSHTILTYHNDETGGNSI